MLDTTIYIGPYEAAALAGAICVVAGYAFAKWPELPIILQRSVRKVKAGLETAKASELVPEEHEDIYDLAYAEILAWEKDLADGQLSREEIQARGVGAYRVGKAVLAKLGR